MDTFSPEEMSRLRRLLEVDAIRRLRLDYAFFMDLRDFDRMIELFTEDAVCEYGPYGSWHGKTTILENYKATFTGERAAPFTSLHVDTNHRVDLVSDTLAVGQCYLTDVATHVAPTENPLVWYALYDEEYRKVEGEWKFARSSLQFFWPERHASSPYI
tara:strand:+ start:1436 stop:1909 length:474 start_codon:yes stop_codon:yes gene_type:complete